MFASATEEFATRGYEGASLNAILERSGMSKSSLYYYFDDKADLFVSLAERSVAYLFREAGGFDLQRLTAENFWADLETQLMHIVTVMAQDTWYVKLARAIMRLRGEPSGFARTTRLFEAARRYVSAFLVHGQELGVIRNDLPQSLMVDATMGLGEAIDTWMFSHWDELDYEARAAIVHSNVDLFKRLLGT
ncbi:MAG: TetR/AcrR family transcriptional regulator [Verrucomicrobia bacterium]|nr:TetR/AcrR family transcriptional regulator [Verrucomicrobiota bacterium]